LKRLRKRLFGSGNPHNARVSKQRTSKCQLLSLRRITSKHDYPLK
jgi:hypothetical protein